jgi:AMMECR1 domain-containing protein
VRTPFSPFAWKTLRRPLAARQRVEVTRALRALLRFQRTLTNFPKLPTVPDATPFVSLYAEGSLRGCYGSNEGSAGERLVRAFLHALDDGRFGGVAASQRESIVAQVSFPRNARLQNPETALEEIEPGTHGVALVREPGKGALFLPHVARDERIDAPELLVRLARKAGLGDEGWRDGALYLFETEEVVTPEEASRDETSRGVEAAARWLSTLVGGDGRVTFAVDPRGRKRVATGPMHHGRAAVVVQALSAHGGRPTLVARARRRLEEDIRAALRGDSVEGWPTDPPRVAGTLALAVLASVPVRDELATFVAHNDITQAPWHAGQVVAALGREAPPALWAACVTDLDRRPWAPYALLGAQARGDRAVATRLCRTLADAIRSNAPYRGAASVTKIPEIALTAVALEALSAHPLAATRSAIARGREFLQNIQLVGKRLYGALDPALAHGAFPLSPVVDQLRCDVTGHALLAILATS